MKTASFALGFVVACLQAGAAYADAQDTIDHRKHIMQTISEQAEILGMIASQKAPKDHVAAHARVLALNASAAKAAFTPNVPGGRAKPEVWAQWDEFAKKLDAFASAAEDLSKSVKGGSVEALGPKLQALGCKNCHETYRGPKT